MPRTETIFEIKGSPNLGRRVSQQTSHGCFPFPIIQEPRLLWGIRKQEEANNSSDERHTSLNDEQPLPPLDGRIVDLKYTKGDQSTESRR